MSELMVRHAKAGSVLLVRHAKAGSRSAWEGPDADRPLTGKGWDQAHTLTDVLRPWPIGMVATSPYLRCQQTVSGLALAHGLDLAIDERLSEGAATGPARRWLDELLGSSVTSVLCSHGDLIPELVDTLLRDGMTVAGDRGCAKGSVWVVRHGRNGLIGSYSAEPRLVPSPT